MRRIGFLLMVSGGIASCGWEADGGARLEQLYHPDGGARDAGTTSPDPGTEQGADPTGPDGGSDSGPGFDLSLGEVSATDLEGYWIGRIVQQGEIAPLFAPWPITTTDWFVGIATADTIEWRLCSEVPIVHDEDPDNDFVTRMPEGTAQALRDRRPLRLQVRGGMLPSQTVLWTWGLTDPQDGVSPLPKSPGDPRVEDTDGDGKPGVTVEVLSPVPGERWLVRRVRFTFPETSVSSDGTWMAGPLQYTIEEQAVGASPAALKADSPITPKEGSFFVFRRVPAIDCATLSALGEAAFEGVPSP